MLKEQKNTKKQGDVGQALAIAYFSINGYTVSLPLSESEIYDLIVDIDDKLCKVQVKTTYHKNSAGNYQFLLKTSGWITGKKKCFVRHFDPTKVDYLFLVNELGGQYLIPSSEIKTNSTITISSKMEKFKVHPW